MIKAPGLPPGDLSRHPGSAALALRCTSSPSSAAYRGCAFWPLKNASDSGAFTRVFRMITIRSIGIGWSSVMRSLWQLERPERLCGRPPLRSTGTES